MRASVEAVRLAVLLERRAGRGEGGECALARWWNEHTSGIACFLFHKSAHYYFATRRRQSSAFFSLERQDRLSLSTRGARATHTLSTGERYKGRDLAQAGPVAEHRRRKRVPREKNTPILLSVKVEGTKKKGRRKTGKNGARSRARHPGAPRSSPAARGAAVDPRVGPVALGEERAEVSVARTGSKGKGPTNTFNEIYL
jgi:hypothetical protein